MGNNQGNTKGAAQDRRERANQVEKGDSKDATKNPRGRQMPNEKGGANPGARGEVAPDPNLKQP